MVRWYYLMGSPTTTLLHADPAAGPHLRGRERLFIDLVRWCVVAVLVAAAAFYAWKSIKWQIMIDSPVMHYVNFLIAHGRKPYTDITDNNMPGAYYTEALAMRVFGAGDLGWRIYDYFLLAAMTGALMLIARGDRSSGRSGSRGSTGDWVAGLFAGGLFIVVHAAEGPQYSVEREQVITVLLVFSYLALFAAVRRQQPLWMLAMGLTGGLATSIKPSFLPLTLLLIAMMAVVLHRRRVAWLPYAAWALAGLTMVALLDLGFLVHYNALEGFLFILRVVTPTYAGLARESLGVLLSLSLPDYIPLLVLLTVVGAAALGRRHARWTWERWSILLGVCFGLLSYLAQGKPFAHHRYTMLVLLFLLMGYELLEALRQRGLPRWLAIAAFAWVILRVVPMDMREVLHTSRLVTSGQTPLTMALEDDLNRLGGTAALQDKVQCFDLVFGCLNSLYHLRVVENTSYTGDLLLFAKQDGPAVEYYRSKYWALEQRDPAQVLVMSNEWFQLPNSFNKVDYWPAFKAFLAAHYTLVVQRRFEHQGRDPMNPEAYRIYIRDGSPLLQRSPALQEARMPEGTTTQYPVR